MRKIVLEAPRHPVALPCRAARAPQQCPPPPWRPCLSRLGLGSQSSREPRQDGCYVLLSQPGSLHHALRLRERFDRLPRAAFGQQPDATRLEDLDSRVSIFVLPCELGLHQLTWSLASRSFGPDAHADARCLRVAELHARPVDAAARLYRFTEPAQAIEA